MIGEGSGLGGRASAQLLGEPSARVDALDHLAAIESWVGIRPDLGLLDQEIAQVRREKEAAVDRHHYTAAAAQRDKEKQLLAARAAREQSGAQAAAARMSLAWELDRVYAELEKLRAVLRRHSIDPGDDGT